MSKTFLVCISHPSSGAISVVVGGKGVSGRTTAIKKAVVHIAHSIHATPFGTLASMYFPYSFTTLGLSTYSCGAIIRFLKSHGYSVTARPAPFTYSGVFTCKSF